MMLGVARTVSATGPRRIAALIAGLGAVVALVGIIQRPLYSGQIYGFWTPIMQGSPFGPFVNKNHFAGWMVMALPLTLALLVSGIARSMASVKAGWRNRVLWFSSPEASRLILVGAGATVMALALMLTMSRSGIGAFVVSVLVTGWLVSSAFDNRARKITATVCLVLLVVVVVAWTGPAVLASRFSTADWGEFNNRRGAWADAWSIAREFPLTGTGLNTYWAAALFYQKHELAYFFAQAHNDYLQLAAEGGLLLTVPAIACLVLFIRDLRRGMRDQRGTIDWWLRAGAVTSLVAIALQESVDFSLQMPGNAALFAVVCAVALHRPAAPPPAAGDRRPTRESGRPRLRLIAPGDQDHRCR
jgi:O-antigen ligase